MPPAEDTLILALEAVNAESVFFLCQKIGPRLAPGGAIVNLSSSSAKLATTIEVASYAASKTTILSITRSFAYALASRPVRVNAIELQFAATSLGERIYAEKPKRFTKRLEKRFDAWRDREPVAG